MQRQDPTRRWIAQHAPVLFAIHRVASEIHHSTHAGLTAYQAVSGNPDSASYYFPTKFAMEHPRWPNHWQEWNSRTGPAPAAVDDLAPLIDALNDVMENACRSNMADRGWVTAASRTAAELEQSLSQLLERALTSTR